jgi:hypothetical protein
LALSSSQAKWFYSGLGADIPSFNEEAKHNQLTTSLATMPER